MHSYLSAEQLVLQPGICFVVHFGPVGARLVFCLQIGRVLSESLEFGLETIFDSCEIVDAILTVSENLFSASENVPVNFTSDRVD